MPWECKFVLFFPTPKLNVKLLDQWASVCARTHARRTQSNCEFRIWGSTPGPAFKTNYKRCSPWRSTHTLPRRSLLQNVTWFYPANVNVFSFTP